MMYILTQQEYDDLKNGDKQKNLDTIQELCTMVANNMPIEIDNCPEKSPWGCIRTPDIKINRYVSDGDDIWEDESSTCICDDCPVEHLCPYPYKEFSK